MEELDPYLVSDKHPEYIPHVSLYYKDEKEPAPVVKPLIWHADEILIEHNGGKVMVPFCLHKNQDPVDHTPKHQEESDLRWKASGYEIAAELEQMHYYIAAAELRKIIGEINMKREHPIAKRLRIIASNINDMKLVDR